MRRRRGGRRPAARAGGTNARRCGRRAFDALDEQADLVEQALGRRAPPSAPPPRRRPPAGASRPWSARGRCSTTTGGVSMSPRALQATRENSRPSMSGSPRSSTMQLKPVVLQRLQRRARALHVANLQPLAFQTLDQRLAARRCRPRRPGCGSERSMVLRRQRLDDPHQLLARRRLRKIADRAHGHPALGRVQRRHEVHRDAPGLGLGPQPLHDCPTVDVGQPHVEDDALRAMRLCQPQALAPLGCDQDLEARARGSSRPAAPRRSDRLR